MTRLIIILLLLVGHLSSSFAENTIEVFITREKTLPDIPSVKNRGYNVLLYQLDGVDAVQEAMAKRANQKLQAQIRRIEKKIGLKKLVNMTDFERNQLFLKELEQSGSSLQEIQQTVVSPQDREAIASAMGDLIYAEQHGIDITMLPAVMIGDQLYRQVNSLETLIDNNKPEKDIQ